MPRETKQRGLVSGIRTLDNLFALVMDGRGVKSVWSLLRETDSRRPRLWANPAEIAPYLKAKQKHGGMAPCKLSPYQSVMFPC